LPAGYPGVIGVGATAKDGSRAAYSETGPQVALVAPGGSADGHPADDLPVLTPGGGTGTASGTSFAAPQVAAAAALVLSVNPSLTADDAGAIVVATAAPIRSSPDTSYGHGMLDLFAAVKAASLPHRVAGTDRYGTAAALAQTGWPTTTGVVFVASGDTFADALGSGAAAAVNGAPILLTNACGLPLTTANQLRRLQPAAVYVVGGPLAVCDQVLQSIGQVAGVTPIRVAGANRYATNAQLIDRFWNGTAATAYVTTGANFPDGLTGGARAAKDGAPLLLTDTCALPPEISAELARLAPQVVKVIGGPLAVCPAVLDGITAAAHGAVVTRVAGADRIQTGIAVASDGWSQATTAVVASAGTFPDALSATAYAALKGVPLLINDGCAADPAVGSELRALGAAAMGFTVAGGSLALCGAAIAPLAVALST
jgi:putative cell wall-binding protein